MDAAIPATQTQDCEVSSTQPATHVSSSPAMRIYRHALESIFAMLELRDLSRALAVSRSWSAAVRSMKPAHASIERNLGKAIHDGNEIHPLPPISQLIASPLVRHVAAIHVRGADYGPMALTVGDLELLSAHVPNLASLWCSLHLAPEDDPIAWPAKLTSLELRLVGELSAATFNTVLKTLAALPALESITLTAPPDLSGVDFSLLATAASLTDLSLLCESADTQGLSGEIMAQFRTSLGHLRRLEFTDLDAVSLPRLLQPPVTARWQSIGLLFADAHAGDLLTTLPSLTRLDLSFVDAAPHADFLRKLPLLTALDLDLGVRDGAEERSWHIRNDPLLLSLLPCTGLTELNLNCGFHSAHLTTLFASLTKISKLEVCCALDSLRCFASGPITLSLESLFIDQIEPLPIAELDHLYALHRLHSLDIAGCFESRLPEATVNSLCPPTALFPLLTRFAYSHGYAPDEDVDRTGVSFEWTQARLTQ